MELVGRTIWGESRYIHNVDEKCVIYCTLQKNKEESLVDFVVGLPGGNAWMSKEKSKEYRLGIDGNVGAFTGKHPDRVFVNFYEKDAAFADFYTEDGQIIKKMVIHDNKFYMFDEDAYYEVSSDAKFRDGSLMKLLLVKMKSTNICIQTSFLKRRNLPRHFWKCLNPYGKP